MANKHTHQYKRVDIGHDKNYWVMKCMKPGCTHYTAGKSKLSFPLLRGQLAECSRCDEAFVLDRRALRMESPCCNKCVKKKTTTVEAIKSADEFFGELMDDVSRIKID